jgi:hypothetical protein
MSAEEVDRGAAPFVSAIGEAVIPGGYLENALLANRLGLSEEIELRTKDVNLRRADLFHRPVESYGAVGVVATGTGMEAVVRRIKTFSQDCDKLAREVLGAAYPIGRRVSGRSFEELKAILTSVDLEQLEDDRAREDLRAARDVITTFGWSSSWLTRSTEHVAQRAAPFFGAIGEAVIGAAALEKVLLADIGARQLQDQSTHAALAENLSDLERAMAGRLMRNLKRLGLSEELTVRINDVIQRRNDLIHRLMETYDAVAVIMTGDGMDAAVRRIQTISEDCDMLAREIIPALYPAIERVSGRSFEELSAILMRVDLEQLEDAPTREELRAARDQMTTFGWS